MRIVLPVLMSVALGAISACATVALAPGADKVRLTQTAADVAACTPVGNLHLGAGPNGPPNPAAALRNEVIGLGGNTAFVTTGSLTIPTDGVAYKCP